MTVAVACLTTCTAAPLLSSASTTSSREHPSLPALRATTTNITDTMARDARASPAASLPPSAAGTKTRRSHRKSRNGCSECKRRHIRCDEGRPSCTNCTIAERSCSFPTTPPTGTATGTGTGPQAASSLEVPSHPPHHSQAHSPARSTSSGGSLPSTGRYAVSGDETPQQRLPSFNESFADAAPAPPVPVQVVPGAANLNLNPLSAAAAATGSAPGSLLASTFTPQHLQLLHHVENNMEGDIMGRGQTTTVIDMAIRHALDAPYLLDQLLAFSALHCAHSRPDHAPTFRHLATELQTRGIAYFSKETERLARDEASYGPPHFLYATLLSVHTLAETLSYLRSDFELFVERFIDCLHLHRGILFIVRPQMQVLMQSELEPILALTQIQLPRDPRRGSETDSLNALLASSDLPPAHANACREASGLLQWAFDLSARLPQSDIPHAVSGWSVVVPPEFAEVLRERRPEALVVMAYYGALVHRTRRYWVCSSNGAYMISAIARHLGEGWRGALQWPLEVLERERD